MTDGPLKPLTPVELLVCDCVAHGWSYAKIAEECRITINTAYVHVSNIAAKLPWEEDMKPYYHVFLWLQHRQWLIQRAKEAA